jgi:hypothetical protein
MTAPWAYQYQAVSFSIRNKISPGTQRDYIRVRRGRDKPYSFRHDDSDTESRRALKRRGRQSLSQ